MSQKLNLNIKQILNQRKKINNEQKIKYNSTNISQRGKIKKLIEKSTNKKNSKNNKLKYKGSKSNKPKRINNNINNYNDKNEFLKNTPENTLNLKGYYSKLNKENLGTNFISIKKISEWDKVESSLNLLENYDKNKDYKGIIKKNIIQNFTKIKKYNYKNHNKNFVNSMNNMINTLWKDDIKNSKCNRTINFKLNNLTNPLNTSINTSFEFNKTVKINNTPPDNIDQPYLQSLYLYNDNYFSNNIIFNKIKYHSANKIKRNISNYSNDKKKIVKNYTDVFNRSFLRPSIQSIENEKNIIRKRINKSLSKSNNIFKSGSFLDVNKISKNNENKKLINLGGLELNLKKCDNFYNNYRRPEFMRKEEYNKFNEKTKTIGNWSSIKFNNENIKSFSLKKFIKQKGN